MGVCVNLFVRSHIGGLVIVDLWNETRKSYMIIESFTFVARYIEVSEGDSPARISRASSLGLYVAGKMTSPCISQP